MALLEELVEEMLLRLQPAEPERLFHTAVVCKPWRRLVSEPCFRRHFHQFHRSPPKLGFFCSTMGDAGHVACFCFVRAAASSSLPRAAYHYGGRWGWRALVVCHGRVLLHDAAATLVDRPNPFKKGFVIY